MLQGKRRVRAVQLYSLRPWLVLFYPVMSTAVHSASRDPFKTTHFLAQIALNIPLPSEGYRFPSFSFLKYRAGRLTMRVCWQHWQQGCNASPHKAIKNVFKDMPCWVLPLCQTPQSSAVCLDQALLLCGWPPRASCRLEASSKGTLELTGLRPQPGRYPLHEPLLKSSSHSSSCHHSMSRFSDFY